MNLYLYLLLYLYLCLFWQTAFVPKPVDGEGGSIERGDLEAALCKSCFDSLCPVLFCLSFCCDQHVDCDQFRLFSCFSLLVLPSVCVILVRLIGGLVMWKQIRADRLMSFVQMLPKGDSSLVGSFINRQQGSHFAFSFSTAF